MKLLVIYLYFAEPKGSGPATMRILSYIDFHNQLYGHLKKKKKFFFFWKILWSEMANQDDSNYKWLSISRYIFYVWLTNP